MIRKTILRICILTLICFVQIISSCNSETSPVKECDIIIDIPQSEKPSFEDMLAGVRDAVINTNYGVDNPNNKYIHLALVALKEYLIEMDFESVVYDSNNDEKERKSCEQVTVALTFAYDRNKFDCVSMEFVNCAGHSWSFSTEKHAAINKNTKDNFKEVLKEMYSNKKPDFNSDFTIVSAKKQTCWTEAKLTDIMRTKGCDEIEGIYENTKSSKDMAKYKVAVRKMNDTYYLIYLSGAKNTGDWTEGEIKATLEATSIPQYYKATWIMAGKTENSNYYITFEQYKFNLISDNDTTSYIKMFPSATDKIKRRK